MPGDQNDRESEEGRGPGRRAAIARSAPYVLGALALVGYFVWLIIQMSIHANGGSTVPEATFGAVFLGILAGALAFARAPGRR